MPVPMSPEPDFERLKARHRAVRDQQPEQLRLRIHRALSWLRRAGQAEDGDGRFLFLWIAFNAAYAQEIVDSSPLSEQARFRDYLERVCALDADGRIGALVWAQFPASIRVLLDNPFVFEPFWQHQRGQISADDWRQRFERARSTAHRALASGNTVLVLSVVFQRIYTLRNQLMHGGATWNSAVNRDQVRDCVRLLERLVPVFLELMIESRDDDWGPACYPVVPDASV